MYDAGDWCLCVNEAEGWTRIDLAGGGGGGGGATSWKTSWTSPLSTGITDGQYLAVSVVRQWENVDITAAGIGALVAGDNVSLLVNDTGYLDAAEVNNILAGNNPDGTPNPSAPEYVTDAELTAAIGDGKITIAESGGTVVGDFTVNQAGNKTITLPPAPAPVVPGDGILTIKDSGGSTLGTFTANQATGSNVDITLPPASSTYWDSGTNQLYRKVLLMTYWSAVFCLQRRISRCRPQALPASLALSRLRRSQET